MGRGEMILELAPWRNGETPVGIKTSHERSVRIVDEEEGGINSDNVAAIELGTS
jgi:hypothetical protein